MAEVTHHYHWTDGPAACGAMDQRRTQDQSKVDCAACLREVIVCYAVIPRVTGAIPPGEITEATEMVFVAGRAFVNAAKHEQVVGQIAEERDAIGDELVSARACVDELLVERDALKAERVRALRLAASAQTTASDAFDQRDRAQRQRNDLLHAARTVNNQGGGVDAFLDVAERIRAEH